MKVYITGASGRLGYEVMHTIPGAIALVRGPSGLQNEKLVDFSDVGNLKQALSDCDVLIHLAGSMKFYDAKELYEGNVLLTKRLLQALPDGAKAVYASSISVYGKELKGIVDEDTLPHPDSAYANAKYAAEELVLSRRNSVALRIGPIYGPAYSDYARFMRMIRKKRMVVFGSGKNMVSFVHVSDAAKALKGALGAKPGVYVVTGESVPQEKIYAIAAAELGVSPPALHIPLPLATLFARMLEIIASVSGVKPLITVEHINILGKSREFNCSKAKKELGFKPRPLETGIREIAKSAGF